MLNLVGICHVMTALGFTDLKVGDKSLINS